MRTVYDIIVFKPTRAVVACTWRSDYASELLDNMTRLQPDAMWCWTGAVMWREIPKEKNV